MVLRDASNNNNFISGNLTSGGIPNEIGLLNNLEVLSLAHNFLTIPNPKFDTPCLL